jgi:hypothetical protein
MLSEREKRKKKNVCQKFPASLHLMLWHALRVFQLEVKGAL